MIYFCMEKIRCRMNLLSCKLNEGTKSGRRPLPPLYADIQREWLELVSAWMNPAAVKDGVDIKESSP
jgi:hypothetical protein